MKPEELKQEILARGNIPRHVAVIMDGNGRWARQRGRPRVFGHRQGMKAVREVVEAGRGLGCEVLTLYAFSEENWKRPQPEIRTLMGLLQTYIRREREIFKTNGIRLKCIGRLEKLDPAPRRTLLEAVDYLAGCDRMLLNLAISYGSRSELVDAARTLCREAAAGRLDPEAVDEAAIAGALYTAGQPDPDLLIRTSGELRISNFLLWQIAYAELYITPVLWPDFTRIDFYEAVAAFQQRERRFGRVVEGGRKPRRGPGDRDTRRSEELERWI